MNFSHYSDRILNHDHNRTDIKKNFERMYLPIKICLDVLRKMHQARSILHMPRCTTYRW